MGAEGEGRARIEAEGGPSGLDRARLGTQRDGSELTGCPTGTQPPGFSTRRAEARATNQLTSEPSKKYSVT